MSEGSSSAAVVERARAGNPDAIAELYGRYGRVLFGVAFRLIGSRSDAEDILQDIFVGLPRALEAYEHRENLEGWLKTLTVRASLMAMRTQRRRREISLAELSPSEVSQEVGPSIDQLALEGALMRLSDALREVFVLKVIHGYSHPEIASFLGISAHASEVRLGRARAILEQKLRSSA